MFPKKVPSCHPRDHSSFLPPMQFTSHFYREQQDPVNFRYQVHFLLFLFTVSSFHSCISRCKMGFLTQYLTKSPLKFLFYTCKVLPLYFSFMLLELEFFMPLEFTGEICIKNKLFFVYNKRQIERFTNYRNNFIWFS